MVSASLGIAPMAQAAPPMNPPIQSAQHGSVPVEKTPQPVVPAQPLSVGAAVDDGVAPNMEPQGKVKLIIEALKAVAKFAGKAWNAVVKAAKTSWDTFVSVWNKIPRWVRDIATATGTLWEIYQIIRDFF